MACQRLVALLAFFLSDAAAQYAQSSSQGILAVAQGGPAFDCRHAAVMLPLNHLLYFLLRSRPASLSRSRGRGQRARRPCLFLPSPPSSLRNSIGYEVLPPRDVAGPCTLSQLTTLQALGSVPAQIAAVQAMASNPATFQCHACLVPCFSAGNPKQCAMGCMIPQVAATTARNRRDVAGTPTAARTFAATFMPQSAQPIRLELSSASAAVTSLGTVLLAAIAWCCL